MLLHLRFFDCWTLSGFLSCWLWILSWEFPPKMGCFRSHSFSCTGTLKFHFTWPFVCWLLIPSVPCAETEHSAEPVRWWCGECASTVASPFWDAGMFFPFSVPLLLSGLFIASFCSMQMLSLFSSHHARMLKFVLLCRNWFYETTNCQRSPHLRILWIWKFWTSHSMRYCLWKACQLLPQGSRSFMSKKMKWQK